jgi:hypothetical protein
MGIFSDRVPGLCDRCGLRFRLKSLKEEDILGRKTGLLVCSRCYDKSHPQLDTRGVKTNDKQSVKNPRSDRAENLNSRRLYSWNPVGHETTNVADVKLGRVTVKTT